jgi:hypothetical protein
MPVAAVLAIYTAFASLAYGGQDAPRPVKPNFTTEGTDWSLKVEANGTLEILHKGVVVVKASNVYFGPVGPKGWTWAGPDFKVQNGPNGEPLIVGKIPGLGLEVNGRQQWQSPDRLVIDFVVRASQTIPNAIGGGWDWNLKTDSPSFAGTLPDPELLENNIGWKWQTSPGRALSVRFEPGAAKVFFERHQKSNIRTYVVADSVTTGTRRFSVTVELPEGGRRARTASERYGSPDTKSWFRGALAWDSAPVNLSFLNRDDRPAGRSGFVRAEGDRFVLGNGSPARFWGGNIAASSLLSTPHENIPRQAHRMARLGFNLMRIHHHDSGWVKPNVFDPRFKDTRHLSAQSLETLDWWIKCLKDEGIYVWLDMHVGRELTAADGITGGHEEIARAKGKLLGFCYFNEQVQELMKEFQRNYLNHLNPHTNLRYKDDPAVMGVLLTNENDLSLHYGNLVLPDYKNTFHNAIWDRGYKAFAEKYGLSPSLLYKTWVAGPSKIYLIDIEHNFNELMISDLRGMGLKAPIATTNFWGGEAVYALPALADGDMIDVHSYGKSEAFDANPRYQGNYVSRVAAGQVYGKPLTISEWNVEYPKADRFTSPLYVASIASLQGWDAPMLFTYSANFPLSAARIIPETWSTLHDPAISGVMPAAALAYRQGHISPARKTYCLALDPGQLFGRDLIPDNSATIRTLAEQSKLTIGMPAVKELPWLKPSRPSNDTIILTDPDHDFIPEGQSVVRSDTDELTRDWVQGTQTIDTPRTQSVSGWIGGKTMKTKDATFETSTKKAVIALSSVDNQPLTASRLIMITAIARVLPSPGNKMPFLSEPVVAKITLHSQTAGLQLLALGTDGRVVSSIDPVRTGDNLTVNLPVGGGTHWYLLKAAAPGGSEKRTH